MKRFSEGPDALDFNLAQVLMLLSQHHAAADAAAVQPAAVDLESAGRVFECKTCNRQFPSFQALGGHRASHKKPRLIGDADGPVGTLQHNNKPAAKPRTHECSICGVEFALGQALGGHMRRHRGVAAAAGGAVGTISEDDDHLTINQVHKHGKQVEQQQQEVTTHWPTAEEVSKKKNIAYYGGASSARLHLASTNNFNDAFDLNAPPQPETNHHTIYDPLELTLRCTVALDPLPSLVH